MSENQNVEWKELWRDEYLKWVCGFANAKGGVLIVGKRDNGDIIGVENCKKLLEDIPNKIQTHLGIICDVNLVKESNKELIEIDVKPYNIAVSYQGKYYYRSGSTIQELKGKALNDFLLKKSGKTWDDVIESQATWNDIDENAFETYLKISEENGGLLVTLFQHRLTSEQLARLNLNTRQIKAVEYVKKNGRITNKEYKELNKTSDRTALRDLEKLTDLQVLVKQGDKKGTVYKLKFGG